MLQDDVRARARGEQTADAWLDWLGSDAEPAHGSPVYLVDLSVDRGVEFGTTRLDENSLLTAHGAQRPETLTPLCASPLVGRDASVRVVANGDTLLVGIDVAAPVRIDPDDTALLPLRVQALPRRLWVDRLRTRPWTSLNGSPDQRVARGRPTDTPRRWLLHDWLARHTGAELDGPFGPADAALRPGVEAWESFVCVPLAWFDAMRPFSLDATDARPRYWFEVPWPDGARGAAQQLERAFALNVAPYVDCVLTTLQHGELKPHDAEFLDLPKLEGKKYDGRELRILAAIDAEGDDVRWDAAWLWATRGKLLKRVAHGDDSFASFCLPADKRWKLLAMHRPDTRDAIPIVRLSIAQRTPAQDSPSTAEHGVHVLAAKLHGVDASSAIVRGTGIGAQLVRAVLHSRALTRRLDFVAGVLDADMFGMRRWIDVARVGVTTEAGRIDGRPARFVRLRVPLRAGHALSEIDRECAAEVLSRRLSEASAINLPVVVEVHDDGP